MVAQKRTASDASSWALSYTRRLLDATFAIVALIAFFPLMAFAALLVRLGSSGPVFFRQRRMGRNGREFTLYKFRSMSTCGDNGNGSCITVTGDTRITPVGALLRRYKLDELPQFWNVLRGDMCLVGPRPKLPHHEALHMDCRPGITGAATLAFRNEEDFLSEIPEDQLEVFYEMFVKPTKARLDLEYMRSASLASDLNILWRTATSCLFSTEDAVSISAETVAQFEAAQAVRRICSVPPPLQRKSPRSAAHEFQPELEFSRNSASSPTIS
ncbi:MAG: sugar transferase [Acidobacteriaceae bacterium]